MRSSSASCRRPGGKSLPGHTNKCYQADVSYWQNSKYLTDDQQDEVLDNVADVVGVYLASMELRWCIENPDLLSMRFRGLVESIL